MSKLFCLSPGLRILERQMQEPPGYRPRGYGICIIEEMDWKSRGNYSEIVDCVISRMQLEHLKKRVEEIFTEVDKELIFGSMKHRNDFYYLLMGKRSKTLKHKVAGNMKVTVAKAAMLLKDKKGENYVDTAVKILIAVVIGALLLAGLYALFGDVVMPTLTRRIQEMFNYAG